MMPKIKNILIFVGIAAALILVYVFFIKSDTEDPLLISSDGNPISETGGVATSQSPQITQDFLSTLLNIKNIKLDDSILSDKAFLSLHDSSFPLIPDQQIGRPNPFAPIGSVNVNEPTTPPASGAPTTPASSTTPTTPPASSSTTTTNTTTTTTTPSNSNTPATNPPPASNGAGGAGATAN